MRAQDGGTAYRNVRRRRHPRMTQCRTKLPAARTAADKKKTGGANAVGTHAVFLRYSIAQSGKGGQTCRLPSLSGFLSYSFSEGNRSSRQPIARGESPDKQRIYAAQDGAFARFCGSPFAAMPCAQSGFAAGNRRPPLRTEDRHAPLSPHDTVSVVFPLLPDVFGKQ